MVLLQKVTVVDSAGAKGVEVDFAITIKVQLLEEIMDFITLKGISEFLF